MKSLPRVSVVMSVRDGAAHLEETLSSVLSQKGVAFEVVVVNDGSRDASGEMLDACAARDDRVRVFHRAPMGLTRGLILGCAEARGEFIARQDCGDRSCSGRLEQMTEMFDSDPDVVMASVGARFFGPRDEILYEIVQSAEELHEGLGRITLAEICGPSHHGATMFRKSVYEAVGGYRAAFDVAQDLDLWLRVAERGKCTATNTVLYEARLFSGSISHLRRAEQLRTSQVILDCATIRRRGGNDAIEIAAWLENRNREPIVAPYNNRREEARFNNFLANVLRGRDRDRAREYYSASLRACFWQPKVWLRLIEMDLLR